MAHCPDCGENLDDVPQGQPCPRCGGPNRSIQIEAMAAMAQATAAAPTIDIAQSDHVSWRRKWAGVIGCHDRLKEIYSSPNFAGGNLEADQRALDFFVECDHMRDWLEGDLSSLPGVTPRDLDSHFGSSPPLQVCNAICNSHKHHTRRSGTTARIRNTQIRPDGVSITIEVNWATSAAYTVDALDLADDCVNSWQSFFQRHGIDLSR